MNRVPFHVAKNIGFILLFGILAAVIGSSIRHHEDSAQSLNTLINELTPLNKKLQLVNTHLNTAREDFQIYTRLERIGGDDLLGPLGFLNNRLREMERMLADEGINFTQGSFVKPAKTIRLALFTHLEELEETGDPTSDTSLVLLEAIETESVRLRGVLQGLLNQMIKDRPNSELIPFIHTVSQSLASFDELFNRYSVQEYLQLDDAIQAVTRAGQLLEEMNLGAVVFQDEVRIGGFVQELKRVLKRYRITLAGYQDEIERGGDHTDTLVMIQEVASRVWAQIEEKLYVINHRIERYSETTQKRIATLNEQRKERFLWISGLALVVGILISWWLGRVLGQRMEALAQGAQAFARGELDHRIALSSRDVFAQLGQAFNDMAVKLREKEAALEENLQSLESRVAERTRELEEAVTREGEANRTKSHFLANMSHEIRTPMNAVMGLTDLALETTLPPRGRDYLNKIADASRSLLRIINDILDFSKIDAGKLDLEMTGFHLRDIFPRLGNLFREQIAEKNLELILDDAQGARVALIGDYLRLEQILMNLISNAIKFTESGEVVVRVAWQEMADERVELSFWIEDSGIGMTSEQVERLFNPFVQADSSTTRRFGGTGLGLSISKRLVELMGGRIRVDSRPGNGSIFFFSVPFQRWPEAEGRGLILPEEIRCQKVLVVDDHPKAQAGVMALFDGFEMAVSGVGSPEEAIQAVAHSLEEGAPYQLVVVDWLMSGMDGVVTLGQMIDFFQKNDAPLPKTLLLTLSGREEEIKNHPRSQVVGGTMAKPITYADLYESLLALYGQSLGNSNLLERDGVDPDSVAQQVAGAKVLLVEDNAINRQVAGEMLRGVGLDVEMAVHGVQAVEMVAEGDYELVLMDIQMPRMDGYAATRRIRKGLKRDDLPILAMTAHAMSGDREKSLAAGMDDHITKPIDRKQLFACLKQWIPHRERGESMAVSAKRIPVVKTPQADSSPAGSLPDAIPGVDLVSALARLNGNQRLLRSILCEFYRDFRASGEMVRQGLLGRRKEDADEAARLLHTIKGMAGNMSAGHLFEAARTLELAIKEEQKERWLELMERFDGALAVVMSAIEPMTFCQKVPVDQSQGDDLVAFEGEEGAGSGEAPAAPRDLSASLDHLAGLLENASFEAQEVFEALQATLVGRGKESDRALEQLAQAIDRFDYKSAREIFSGLVAGLGVSLGEDG
ncbi:MAG: response regulator [Magnetococcales bacterium]|nr:response regulator [Magnetococcales bacterium]